MQGGHHGNTTFLSTTTEVLTDDQQDAGGLEDVLSSDGEYIDFIGTDGTLLDLEDNQRLTNGTFRLGLSDGDVGYDNSDGTLDGWTANDSASLSVLTTELVTGDSSTFASGVGDWTIATGGGSFTSVGGVGTAAHGSGEDNHHITIPITTEIGKEYTVKGTFTQVSGNIYLRVGTSASGTQNLGSTVLFTSGANGTLAYGTHHFTATATTTYVTIHHSSEAAYTIDDFGVATTDMKIVNGGADSGSASEQMAVDGNGYYQIDASFKTVSDNLVRDTTSDGTDTTYYEVYTNNTVAVDSGAIKITYVDSANGALVRLKQSSGALTEDLVVGATYRLTADLKVNSGSSVNWYVVGPNVFLKDGLTDTNFTTYSVEFTAVHATSSYLRVNAMGSGEIAFIDNLKLERITAPKVFISAGTSANSSNYGIVENTSDNPTIRCFAASVATSLHVTVGIKDSDVATNYCLVDNISVKQVDKFADHIIDVTGDYGGIPTEASFAVSSNKAELKAVNSKRPVVCIPFQTRPGRAYRVKLTSDDTSGTNTPGGAYIGVSTHPMTWAGTSGNSLSVLSGEAKIRDGGTGWISGGSEEVFIVANNRKCFALIYNENSTTNSSRDYTGLYLQEEGYGAAWTLANRQEIIPQLPF